MVRRFEHTDSFRPAARAIIFDGASILLLHHRREIVILPGGGANKREKITGINLLPIFETKVLNREVKEETELDIKGKSRVLVCFVEWFNDPERTMSRLDFVYAVKLNPEIASKAVARREITKVEWVRAVDTFSFPSSLAPNAKAAIMSFTRLLTGQRSSAPEFINI